MTTNESRLAEPNSAHIGEGVTFKGSISAPDVIVVDGIVEGDVTARSVRVGVSGSIKGTVTSIDADVHGKLCDKIEVKSSCSFAPPAISRAASLAGMYRSSGEPSSPRRSRRRRRKPRRCGPLPSDHRSTTPPIRARSNPQRSNLPRQSRRYLKRSLPFYWVGAA